MRKKLTCMVFPLVAFSFGYSEASIKIKDAELQNMNETNLLDMWTTSNALSAGDPFSVFVKVNTSFQAPQEVRLVLIAKLGSLNVPLQTMSEGLWWFHNSGTLSAGGYAFSVDVILENRNETDELRSQITLLQQEIKELENQIAIEEDDAERAILSEQLLEKQVAEQELHNEIADNQLLVKTETLNFLIN